MSEMTAKDEYLYALKAIRCAEVTNETLLYACKEIENYVSALEAELKEANETIERERSLRSTTIAERDALRERLKLASEQMKELKDKCEDEALEAKFYDRD